MTEALLRLQRLSAGFEKNVVFRRVSLTVPRRGALGILGPMGAGKSTLLRTLGRWNDLRPSFWAHGSIIVQPDGQDLLHDVDRTLAHRQFALMQQKARLFTSSVLENAIAGISHEGTSVGRRLELAYDVLAPWQLWPLFQERLFEPVTALELSEQRMLTLARLTAAGARAILADEPLRDLSEQGAQALQDMLLEVKKRHALVVVTHNQRVAKALLDHAALLAGGTLVEVTGAKQFFSEPRTELGRRYLKSGSCWPSQEEMDPDWVEHQEKLRREESGEPEPPPTAEAVAKKNPSWIPTPLERVRRPGGFHWIQRGLLGGMQWPGLLQDVETDLDGCLHLGVRHLVNLTEAEFPREALQGRTLELHHYPIVDMQAPAVDSCRAMCEQVREWIDRGEATVFHCRAGLGRTGTMLACMRVLDGCNAVSAVEEVRRVNPMYIQSQEQLDFIEIFADAMHRGSHPLVNIR